MATSDIQTGKVRMLGQQFQMGSEVMWRIFAMMSP
jgi:hypothetical protein